MNTKKTTQEQISAFADGELCDAQIDIALAALRQPEGRESWDAYHQIGDLLRSDDMAVSLSPDFAARMSARLEAEPTIIAPAMVPALVAPNASDAAARGVRRFAVPGVLAAAVAASAFFATPHVMVAMKSGSSPASMIAVAESQPASAGRAASARSSASARTTEAPILAVASQAGTPPSAGSSVSAAAATAASANGQPAVLRDAGIDEYLMAHQRFSPSVYSTAQFARSATFASDDK